MNFKQQLKQDREEFLYILNKIKNKDKLDESLKSHKLYSKLKEIKEKIELDNSLIPYQKIITIINKKELKQLLKEKILTKINKKFYCFDLDVIDTYLLIQTLIPNSVFCCESSANLLGISTFIDENINIMVNNRIKFWYYQKKFPNSVFFLTKKKYMNLGITKHNSYMKNTIIIYDLEKTILDVLNFSKKINTQTINDINDFLENNINLIDEQKMLKYIKELKFFKKNKKEGILYEWFLQKTKTI